MRTGTFWLLMPFMTVALGGCLQKAKTSVSALGSISLPSPQLEASSPPDFENASEKGFVRFRGSCVPVINGFQIQFIPSTGASSEWFNIPIPAPEDLREALKRANYPLVPGEYDSSCEEDGHYDFWVTMHQIVDWMGGTLQDLPEISQINLRGVSPFLASNILYLPFHDDANEPEANTFEFYAGIYPVPIGVEYCQPFNVSLGRQTGAEITYKVKNSVARTFELTLESGLTFGSNFKLYSTTDCSGTHLSDIATAVTFPVGVEHLRYSYKVTSIVSPEKKMTLSETFEAVGVVREFKVKTDSALTSVYKVILAPETLVFTDGDECQMVDLIVVGSNGVATKDYPSNINISVSNPDPAKFELRSSCNETGTALSSSTVLMFESGKDYKKTIYVKSLGGVNSSTAGGISLTESTTYISEEIPDLYINVNSSVDHLRLLRGESLSSLFNHECYPFEVSLVNSGGAPVPSSHEIRFKFSSWDDIQIFDDPDCRNTNLVSSELAFSPGEMQQTYYWSRRQPATGLPHYMVPTSSSGINVEVLSTPLVAQPTFSDNSLLGLNILKSPLDWLGRGRGDIFHWYYLPMVFMLPTDIQVGESLELPPINQPGSRLYIGGDKVKRTYDSGFSEGFGTFRDLFRNFWDLTSYDPSLLWAYHPSDVSVNLVAQPGSAALLGVYVYFPSLPGGSKQQLLENLLSDTSKKYQLMVNADGSLHIEYDEVLPSVHCVTSPGLIHAGKWQSVFVRFANNSGGHECRIYVDGALSIIDGTLPGWLKEWGPQIGSNLPNEKLEAYILEIIVDKDLTSNGISRYADSVIEDLHNEYFEKRYRPVP